MKPMNKMKAKYLLLSLFIINYSIACTQQTEKDIDLICHEWSLEKSIDPYAGGVETVNDEDNFKRIIFDCNKTYVEIDTDNEVYGKWGFNKEENALGLKILIQNGTAFSTDTIVDDFRWKIVELNSEILVLGVQGRHGVVKYHYRKLK